MLKASAVDWKIYLVWAQTTGLELFRSLLDFCPQPVITCRQADVVSATTLKGSHVGPDPLSNLNVVIQMAAERLHTDSAWWGVTLREEGGGDGTGEAKRESDSPPPSTHNLFLTLLLFSLYLAGFMRLILDNLAVTRHCTQPLLIFNEGSGPSAPAFWAFNGEFSSHICALWPLRHFPKIAADVKKLFTVLHSPSSVMNATP